MRIAGCGMSSDVGHGSMTSTHSSRASVQHATLLVTLTARAISVISSLTTYQVYQQHGIILRFSVFSRGVHPLTTRYLSYHVTRAHPDRDTRIIYSFLSRSHQTRVEAPPRRGFYWLLNSIYSLFLFTLYTHHALSSLLYCLHFVSTPPLYQLYTGRRRAATALFAIDPARRRTTRGSRTLRGG